MPGSVLLEDDRGTWVRLGTAGNRRRLRDGVRERPVAHWAPTRERRARRHRGVAAMLVPYAPPSTVCALAGSAAPLGAVDSARRPKAVTRAGFPLETRVGQDRHPAHGAGYPVPRLRRRSTHRDVTVAWVCGTRHPSRTGIIDHCSSSGNVVGKVPRCHRGTGVGPQKLGRVSVVPVLLEPPHSQCTTETVL